MHIKYVHITHTSHTDNIHCLWLVSPASTKHHGGEDSVYGWIPIIKNSAWHLVGIKEVLFNIRDFPGG